MTGPSVADVLEGADGVPVLIYDDPRPIDSIWFAGEDAGGWSVSVPGYKSTRIVAYKEHGQGDYVPYYAVYAGDEIIARVPGHMVSVHYAALSRAKASGASA